MHADATYLDSLITGGYFAPQVKEWEDAHRAIPGGFYATLCREGGLERAEAELARVVEHEHRHVFAGALAPIARGIHACVEADQSWAMGEMKMGWTPVLEGAQAKVLGARRIIALIKPPMSEDDPHGVFAPRGGLGFFGALIDIEKCDRLRVGLIFPSLRTMEEKDGFVVVWISRAGSLSITVRWPTPVSKSDYFLHTVGLAEHPCEHNTRQLFDLDVALSFPGATEYLARHIGKLASYLNFIASRMR